MMKRKDAPLCGGYCRFQAVPVESISHSRDFFFFFANHGTYIRWELRNRRVINLVFDMLKAFDQISRRHISDVYSPKRLFYVHASAICYELPSKISTMLQINV